MGTIPDLMNLKRSLLPAEAVQALESYGKIAPEVPYGSQYFQENLPLPPQGPAQQMAGNIGALVPLSPAEILQTARLARKAAMAGGATAKQAGRLVGEELNAAMLGERPNTLLGAVTPQPMFLDVYHGTPHRFAPTSRNALGEFDASKIGTGEGAQVYGHGLYVAENPAVAKGYQETLAYKAFDIKPEAEKLGLNLPAGTRGEFMRQVQANKPPEVLARQLQNANIAARDLPQEKLTELFRSYQEKGGGNLYKADLPDEMIPKMIDYDKHLSEQSPEIQKILYPYQKKLGTSFGTGSQILKEIAFDRRMKGLDDSPAAVAQQLKEMGISGVQYLDQASRKPGVTSMTQAQLDTRIDILKKDISSGLGNQDRMKQILSALEAERAAHSNLTRNFVIFPGEEKNVKILERK
jgi:hypothetical protein